MKTILAVFVLLTLAGCAKVQFTKPGITQQQFYTDKNACISEAQMHAQNNPFMIPMFAKQCMKGKGYHVVKN